MLMLKLVSKPALGRGLGKLMKEGSAASPSSDPAVKPASLSLGMGALLRGGNGAPKPAGQPEANPPPAQSEQRWKRVTQTSLVVADFLLVGLVARLAFKSGGPLGPTDLMLCIVALVIGAGLTSLALWLDSGAG